MKGTQRDYILAILFNDWMLDRNAFNTLCLISFMDEVDVDTLLEEYIRDLVIRYDGIDNQKRVY